MVRFTLDIDDDLDLKITDKSKNVGMTKTAFIRNSIIQTLNNSEKVKQFDVLHNYTTFLFVINSLFKSVETKEEYKEELRKFVFDCLAVYTNKNCEEVKKNYEN